MTSPPATSLPATLADPPTELVSQVLRFYQDSARDLPWRGGNVSPWAVLVSEFMLQQTPVVRVTPVFRAWIQRWPTPAALSEDSPGDAVRAWGRLGYPKRALRLHACATQITQRFAGKVPDQVPDLLALPGIGDYTARAIAAFAFGQRVPVVDTNVRRVLNRVVRGNTDTGPATAADRDLMAELLPDNPGRAVKFSVAVMELGALVCTSASPQCGTCPVATGCAWVRAGRPESLVRSRTQAWTGTDRQARGRIMAVLRDSAEPVPAAVIDQAWDIPDQRGRCVSSLLADRLIIRLDDGRYSLPS